LKLALGGCDPLGVGCGLENPGASPFYAKGAQACQVYNCAAIGDVLGGAITSTNYQTPETNTFDPTKPLQGPWSDPVNPASQGPLVLETLVVVPASTMPTGGWPVVIYGHGLTLSKETALTFAGWAAQFGFATVAVDFSGHGSRAVRTSKDVNLACTGRCVNRATGDYYAPNDPACAATGCTCEETKSGTTTVPAIAMCPNHDPTSASGYDKCGKSGFVTTSGNNEFASPTPRENGQCYDSPLSSNLAKTRDGFRQTVLDLERVVNAVKACGNGCGAFTADPTKIVYVGVSLGGILGSIASAESPDIKAAMLSVPGGGWVDLLENTDSVAFRCSFIDSLIDAQILSGTKWNLGANTDALCLAADKTAWQGQPGYPTFAATGRWVLDPADPANFASKLATKRFFIQEVTNDEIVPNIATDRLAALTGIAAKQMPGDNTFNPSSPAPSAAVATPTAMESKYIKYTSDTGAAYSHASLIRPANSTTGVIGTLRMQFDAAYWIFQNK
jgi:pimeloyl-ACP methyl ester carboxylesterase